MKAIDFLKEYNNLDDAKQEIVQTISEESAEQKELKSLVAATNNDNVLKQIVNYLKSKIHTATSAVVTDRSTSQTPIATPINKDVAAKKPIAVEDAANLKSQALQLINQLEDPEELDKLISFLRRAEISDLVGRVIVQQFDSIQGDFDKKLSALLTRIKNPIDEKIRFLNKILQQGGIFDGEALLASKTGNIYSLTKNDPVASAIAKTLATEFRGTMGYGPDQGPGEIMMVLLGKNIKLAKKGDLTINNNSVEVKATSRGKKSWSGGRLTTTTGYGRSTSIKKILYTKMIEAGIPAEVLAQYGWPTKSVEQITIPGGLNLNSLGLTNLSNLFKQYLSQENAKKIIEIMLDGIYTKLPEGMGDSVLNLIQSDGSFDNNEFLKEFNKLAHTYYQFIEGHDILMLFNTENGNYALIQDAADFDELFASGKVSLTSHLGWDDDRSSGSSQIVVK